MLKFCSYTLISVLTVGLLATSGDLTITWTSPILPKLHSNNSDINPLGAPISLQEESWISSLINIGAILGPLPFGYISQKWGRKVSLLSIAVPNIVSFILLALVHDLYWYYFARLLAGISLGAGCSLLPIYIAEIAEDSNRGMLSVTLNIFWTFGNIVPYLLGPYLPVLCFNFTLACIPILFFFAFFLIAPESPYFLLSRNKEEEAEEALMKLRSRRKSLVKKEILSISEALNQDKSGSIRDFFKTKANFKALVISLVLIASQQLSGIAVILFYTQLIFQVSGSDLAPEISSIIIGSVLFVSSIIVPFFADRIDRKVFLIISNLGSAIALAIFGGYFYLYEVMNMDVSSFSWIPIASLVFYILMYNLGLAVLPWTVSAELFSVNLKQIGGSLVSFTCWLLSFLLTKFFNDLNENLGKAGTFGLFACCCLISCFFVYFCMPETRGKSFKEIQEILEK